MKVTAFSREIHRLLGSRSESVLLYNDGQFTEGPVWLPQQNCLIWSDIPTSRLLKWSVEQGVSVFRSDSNYANGNTRDGSDRLVTAEQKTRRVTLTERDGSITVIADAFEGRRLNSPNDVVVRSDGSVWFTDPTYGLRECYPGAVSEQPHEYVFRVDEITGVVTAVASDFQKPNGLAFSPDEQWLYVVDSGVTDAVAGNSHIRQFRVLADGTLSGGEVFATTDGTPDGLRFDAEGNLWTSAGDGINVYSPTADWLGRINCPGSVSNLAFGGPRGDQLFITGSSWLYCMRVAVTGAVFGAQ